MTDRNTAPATRASETAAADQGHTLKPWPAFIRISKGGDYLGMSRSMFNDFAQNDPSFPRKVKLSSRCVGYRRAALDAWLEAKERGEA
ncbi:helix-turn-helix transcriptional regulator [Salinisphaera hydrothermalis]|uniref:helix-turn-helix transcriptional regulator n=1 Tax=Salinisphaera hydrothermalis TaxID=563188 RepID=UPI00333E8D83